MKATAGIPRRVGAIAHDEISGMPSDRKIPLMVTDGDTDHHTKRLLPLVMNHVNLKSPID